MASAWLGAVVVNTCLQRPRMAAIAMGYFNQREHQVYADHLRQTAGHFREVALRQPRPFWTARSASHAVYDSGEIAQAYERLRRSSTIRLRAIEPLRTRLAPRIRGREIVLEDSLVIPGLPSTVEYTRGVDISKLLEMANRHSDVPELFEAYNRAAEPVALPNFLSALSALVAKGVLEV